MSDATGTAQSIPSPTIRPHEAAHFGATVAEENHLVRGRATLHLDIWRPTEIDRGHLVAAALVFSKIFRPVDAVVIRAVIRAVVVDSGTAAG